MWYNAKHPEDPRTEMIPHRRECNAQEDKPRILYRHRYTTDPKV